MKGDFSRDTFDLRKNFSRVLMQQGRVLLDADWNEQSSILLHYIRTLANDLIGPHAGPRDSFVIDFLRENGSVVVGEDGNPKDLTIASGHYYVDGILCENQTGLFNDNPVSYFNQPYYQPGETLLPTFPYLIYLDVWERHITCFENENLCEVALGGIDTTTRAQVVWQVRVMHLENWEEDDGCEGVSFPIEGNAYLSARTQPSETSDDPCNIEPDARYRGAENQLYRVEIHSGNVDESGLVVDVEKKATFKWSRENGSVVFPVMNITVGEDTTEVRLANLGRDDKFGLLEGDWVELIDDDYTLRQRAGNLMQIASINRDDMSVRLDGEPEFDVSENPANHPLLRRWDQKAGNPQEGGLTLNAEDNAAEITERVWLKLEDGIQIQFGHPGEPVATYRTGDYWLIPARTATGDVVWSKDDQGNPIGQQSIDRHHYAPLGIAVSSTNLRSCRCTINSLVGCGQNVIRDERRSAVNPDLEAAEPETVKPQAAKPQAAKTKGKKSPK